MFCVAIGSPAAETIGPTGLYKDNKKTYPTCFNSRIFAFSTF